MSIQEQTIQEKLYTASDLEAMPDDGKIYELHNGVVIEVPGDGERQSSLAAWIGYLLVGYIMQHNLGGKVMGADGICVLSPFNTRIPDVAYIQQEAIRAQAEQGFHVGAPDLAVEVVSPSNSATEMQQRAGEYLNAGTRLVWIVNPEKQTTDLYRQDGKRLPLAIDNIVDGYDVIPGLQIPLKTLFNSFTQA